MSVTANYTGRLGNNLFQYVMGRLIAVHFESELNNNWHYSNIIEFKKELNGYSEGDIQLSGYFQQVSRYLQYRNFIKSWLVKPYQTINKTDIILHLRAADYGKAHRIHPQWFLDILAKETFDKVHIVMSPVDWEYLEFFKGYDYILHSGNEKEDFELIASFDKIICSNSTFCWWAAFLSNATTVYTFKKWLPDPNIDLCWGEIRDGEFWV